MRLKIALVLVFVALAVVVGFITRRATGPLVTEAEGNNQSTAVRERAPVLVELFTSEGCSSCPPADQLLTRLEQSQPVAGAEIIALSEHVDYWNRLGWKDPYSSAEFSKRQNDYAVSFNTDDVYTPQMVVDGRAQFVGSNSGKASEAIEEAARDPKANVTATIESEDNKAALLTLAVRVDGLPESSKGGSAEVLLAITESGLRSHVSSGENAGRQLVHSAVVRKFSRIGSIESKNAGGFTAQPVVRIENPWNRQNLRAVIFVQGRANRRVLGVAAVSLGK